MLQLFKQRTIEFVGVMHCGSHWMDSRERASIGAFIGERSVERDNQIRLRNHDVLHYQGLAGEIREFR